jgi:alkylation response protein AidB-like acyl-CoA dehydrogenase
MDFRFSEEDEAFRKDIRAFLEAEWPGGTGDAAVDSDEEYRVERAFEKKLAERGWLTQAWPPEYGGEGASHVRQAIKNEECSYFRAPIGGGPGGQATGLVGPAVMAHGTEEQKRRFLPPIAAGDAYWCQGFSEPEAGSDLASVKTRAERTGDHYVLNGQKTWTSGAAYADWIHVLARTDPEAPKHKGISYFLVDMKSPGITVRPLINLAGNAGFNEVFFDNVRVPAKNLVGEENRGWYIGTTTLDFERSSIGSAVGQRLQVETLITYAKDHEKDGASVLGHTAALRYELAERLLETHVAKMLSYRVVTMQARGLVPNHEASMTKLFASELSQRIARTGIRVAGLYGQLMPGSEHAPARGRYGSMYLQTLGSTIAGGTSEIQRNIIAQRGLELPRN